MLQGLLVAEGHKIGRRHVKTLMKRMEIEALYRRPRTTKPEPGHKIYPYLLRGMAITRPNQVWAMDITYIPMARGFLYLAVVLDWFSRRACCRGGCRSRWRQRSVVETLRTLSPRHGKPDIFNTDQGSQFTGTTFTGVLIENAIAIRAGWQGRLAGQCLRRAAVAQRQIRGGLSASLRQRQRGPHFDQADTSTTFTTAGGHTRALTA